MGETISKFGRLTQSSGMIRGAIIVPPTVTDLNDITIEVFSDGHLKKLVASTKTDSSGRFTFINKTKQKQIILWFCWKCDGKTGRTPYLNPWRLGDASRIPCYTLKDIEQGEPTAVKQGNVVSTSGIPAAHLNVWLVEQTTRNCQRLAIAKTDANGEFSLKYSPDQVLEKSRRDLRVIVFDGDDEPIVESSDETISLPDRFVHKTWTEDRNVEKTFTLVKKESQTEPLRPEDILYLIEKQNISSDTAGLLKKAASLSQYSGIDIPEALAITAAGPEATITDAIRAGIKAGWLEGDTESKLDAIEDAVEEHHDRRRRRLPDDYPSLEQVLKNRLGENKTLRLAATRLWREAKRDLGEFEERLKQNADLGAHAQALRFTVELSDHVQRFIPIIQELETQFNNSDITTAADLGGWEVSQWKQFLTEKNIELPSDFQDIDNQEVGLNDYARSLRHTFENAYPNSAIRAHADHYMEVYPWGDALKQILSDKTDIDISLPVPRLEREHADLFKGSNGQKAREGLAIMQRLRRLTESVDPLPALVSARLGSAQAIAQYSRHNFIKKFQSEFDNDPRLARTIHVRAVKVADLARYTYSELSDQFNKTPLAVLKHTPKSAEHQQALATWREIFGEQDLAFCDCAHCKSIFGPAAYLFDTLLFLERYSGPDTTKTANVKRFSSNVVDTLNKISEEELVEWIQDDPVFGVGSKRTIGVRKSAAKKILEKRQELGGKFSTFQQVAALKGHGIGNDTLHDILYTSWGAAAENANRHALKFINSVKSKEQLQQRIKQDPMFNYSSKHRHAVSLNMAQKIIDARNERQGKFTSLGQVADVKGVGTETLHHITYSFYQELQQQCLTVNWTEIDQNFNVSALTVMGDRFFAIDDGWLKMRDTHPAYNSWISIGQTNNISSLTDQAGKLLVTKQDGIYQLEPENWLGNVTHQYDFNSISALAHTGWNLLVVSDGTLYAENPLQPDSNGWRDRGEAGDIKCMAYHDKWLYAMRSSETDGTQIVVRSTEAGSEEWTVLEDVPIELTNKPFSSLAVLEGNLYGFLLQSGLIYRRLATPTAIPITTDNPSWQRVGQLSDIVALEISGSLIYGISENGDLLVRDIAALNSPDPEPADWLEVGHIGNVEAMCVSGGALYFSNGNNGINSVDIFPRNVELLMIPVDSISGITNLTASQETFFAVNSNSELITRPISSASQTWTTIGNADNVVSLAAMDGYLFVATESHELLMRPATEDDIPWMKVGTSHDITTLLSHENTLYSVTEDGRLWSYELPSNSQAETPDTLLGQFRSRRPDIPALELTCQNTNIEVPHIDLVNELLSDLVGSTLCAGFSDTQISTTRNTSGTSEERRAWPQYSPPQYVLEMLGRAKRPWSLPYEYEMDRAEQARLQTGVDEHRLVELLWRLQAINTSGQASQDTIIDHHILARHTLQLTENEVEIITTPETDIAEVWGDTIASSVTGSGYVTVNAIQQAGRFDEPSDENNTKKVFFPSFEAAIESAFVRGVDNIRLLPTGCCNPSELWLYATISHLPAILDRLNRFERLRRKTNWTANQLDNVLAQLGYNLNQETLSVIGLLVFLQKRLDLDPDTLLALFVNPPVERPHTIRAEKHVYSAFERLFSSAPIQPPEAPGNESEYSSTSDTIVATIADRVGTGPDEVRYVFANGFVGNGNAVLSDPLSILLDGESLRDTDQAVSLWRSAVSAVYRVSVFADALKLSVVDLVSLTKLWNKPTLFTPNINEPFLDRLDNTIGLIDLAYQADDWPLPANEVLYVATDDPVGRQDHGLDAMQIGNLLHRLHSEILDVIDKNRSDITEPEPELYNVLQQFLGESADDGVELKDGAQKQIDLLFYKISWSGYDSTFNQEVVVRLPVDTINDVSELVPSSDEATQAQATVKEAIEALDNIFRRHIMQARVETSNSEPINDNDYGLALKEFREETRKSLSTHLPDVMSIAELIDPLIWPSFHTSSPDKRIIKSKIFAERLLTEALDQVARHATAVRLRAFERWLAVLHGALLRSKSEARLIEILADTFSIEAPKASVLLKRILHDGGEPLLRRFIDPRGRSNLAASLINATYISSEGGLSVQRLEPGLQMDWAATPPPQEIGGQAFTVTLDANLLVDSLIKIGVGPSGIILIKARQLVVESTGKVTMTLADERSTNVLEIEEGGELQRKVWDQTAVIQILKDLVDDTKACKARFTVEFPSVQAGGTPSEAPVFRVWIETDHGDTPLIAGTHASSLIHFDKAARVVGSTSLPADTWITLTRLPENRRIDLNELAAHSSNKLGLWQNVVALDSLWKCARTESYRQTLIEFIVGGELPNAVLAPALGLTSSEYDAINHFLNPPGNNSAGAKSQERPGWQSLITVIQLSTLARNTGLPFNAMHNWLIAAPNEIYHWCLAAIQASQPEDKYLDVLQALHNPIRERLRDALVAWLITHPRVSGSGTPTPHFEHPEAISRYLFTDVQMSAYMASSRVQFGYAAIQRFIDDVRMGFEPGIEDAEEQELFEREWNWRRFYRLWEANRRVFAYPENWLEPDLRPDKTPFFQELEEELMEGPLTTLSAENAIGNYLSKLVEVARPEIIGIVHEDGIPDANAPLGFRDPELHGTHVFARSRNQPHQIYYRRHLPDNDNRWTPWERIEAELPGTHFVPFVGLGSLYLVSAEFGLGRSADDQCQCSTQTVEQLGESEPTNEAYVRLSHIERRHGQWGRVRQHRAINFPLSSVYLEDISESDDWPDFPYNSFPDVPYTPPRFKSLMVSFMVSALDVEGKPANASMSAVCNSTDGLIELGILAEGVPLSGGMPYSQTFTTYWLDGDHYSFEHLNNITGFRILYSDNSKNVLLDWVQVTINYMSGSPFERSDYEKFELLYENNADTQFPNTSHAQGNEYIMGSINIDLDDVLMQWGNFKEFFKVTTVDESFPPNEVFALRVDADAPDKTNLHLVTLSGVRICKRVRRTFEFLAHKDNPLVKGIWAEGPAAGSNDVCIPHISHVSHNLSLELFPDGSLVTQPPLPPEHQIGLLAGRYKEAEPWQQFFRGSPVSDFYTDELRAVTVQRPYQIIVPSNTNITSASTPKFLDERSENTKGRTFFVEETFDIDILPTWVFRIFWHPQAPGFHRMLQAHGIHRLLSFQSQSLEYDDLHSEQQDIEFFEDEYQPNTAVTGTDSKQFPQANVDFSPIGSYADYNWELFFHAPLLIAQRLSEAGQFEDAEHWFRLLLDPSKGRLNNKPLESFQTRPLRDAPNERIEDLMNILDDQEIPADYIQQVMRHNRNPYQPHLIARLRLSAYQKALVIKYLEHLIAWGDEMFRRAYASDNRTELEIASSRYDFVASILGTRPESLPAINNEAVFSFNTVQELDLGLRTTLEDFITEKATKSGPGNPGGGIGDSGDGGNPGDTPDSSTGPGGPGNLGAIPDTSIISMLNYFCVPHNDRLLRFWDTLADRLWKLRSCRDIEGVHRTLSLYGRQIDPGLLVRATAMGMDIDLLLGYISAPLPQFRFNALLQHAKSACDRAQNFGQALLSTIEKRESEDLSRLRSRHELNLLKGIKRARDEAVHDANEFLAGLWKSREGAELRHEFYSTRLRVSGWEAAEAEALDSAAKNEQSASSASAAAADRALLPNFPVAVEGGYQWDTKSGGSGYFRASQGVNYDYGGRLYVNIEQQKASAATYRAGHKKAKAQRLQRQAHYQRRWDDWQLQKGLAEKDLARLDRQIESAKIRLRITEIEQENQQLQIDQASTVDAFLRDKFTNAQLYRWMESRLSRLHYQQYRLAYDLALKAQQALRFELGLDDDNALLPDTWDPSHRGLEAAADLQHELEKMENQYIELWKREHEKQKVFSLVDRWPLEFLELRQTGSCIIRILESDLDEDEPGDFYRRIKQVSIDIPCVRGPDVTVNARLTLLRSEVRIKAGGNYPRPSDATGGNSDGHFQDEMGGEHIVTTTGVNDTGQLDASNNNDKHAPFEGWGVISTWQIDLDEETNFFERSTISDVKIRIAYTARDGGPSARASAIQARKTQLYNQGREVLLPLNTYFADLWARFTREDAKDRDLSIKLSNDLLPYSLQRDGQPEVAEASFYFASVSSDDISISKPKGDIYDIIKDTTRTDRQLVQFRMESPPQMDSDIELTFEPRSDVPKFGWLLLWAKPTTKKLIQTKRRVKRKARTRETEKGVI